MVASHNLPRYLSGTEIHGSRRQLSWQKLTKHARVTAVATTVLPIVQVVVMFAVQVVVLTTIQAAVLFVYLPPPKRDDFP